MVYCAFHLADYPTLYHVKVVEVVDGKLGSACLVAFPSVEFDGRIEVGEDDGLVVFLQVGLVDARNGKPSRAYTVVVEEIGKDALS